MEVSADHMHAVMETYTCDQQCDVCYKYPRSWQNKPVVRSNKQSFPVGQTFARSVNMGFVRARQA